jgi:hypothetical protein
MPKKANGVPKGKCGAKRQMRCQQGIWVPKGKWDAKKGKWALKGK